MDINNSVFSYIVSNEKVNVFNEEKIFCNNRYYINHSQNTSVQIKKYRSKEIALIGFCIDSHCKISMDKITEAILLYSIEESDNIVDIYRFCNRFAGKYVIFWCDDTSSSTPVLWVFGDATCSLQINYVFLNNYFYVASSDNLISNHLNLKKDKNVEKIRKGSDLLQPLPYNITIFEKMYALLPNHVLNIQNKRVERVSISEEVCITPRNIDILIHDTIDLIKGITNEYYQNNKLVCPLTSGYDSRAVLAFLYNNNHNIECYTFKHNNIGEEMGDRFVPEQICETLGLKHHWIGEKQCDNEVKLGIQKIIGEHYADMIIDWAYMFKEKFPDRTMINGDIIGQICKSGFGNTIPYNLANSYYFQCKLHNKDKNTREEIKKHIEEIKKIRDGKYIYDLFAIESRLGRWASQREMIYSICGVKSLNIFNCREVILKWISIPRELRSQYIVHNIIFSDLLPQLSSIPFNTGQTNNLEIIAKKFWPLYYLGTFLKHFLKD